MSFQYAKKNSLKQNEKQNNRFWNEHDISDINESESNSSEDVNSTSDDKKK